MMNQARNFFTLNLIKTQGLNFQSVFYLRKLNIEPKIRRRTIEPIFPPPGLDLQIPDWKPEEFMKRIGNACNEYSDKFETTKEILECSKDEMIEKGIPPKIRRYIYNIKEQLRRGVLTFEYLERRTAYSSVSAKQKLKK